MAPCIPDMARVSDASNTQQHDAANYSGLDMAVSDTSKIP